MSVIDLAISDCSFVVAPMGKWYQYVGNLPGSSDTWVEASEEQLSFNDPHSPSANALEAFSVVERIIKEEIVKSRHHWDKHEPRMWSRAARIPDHELTDFNFREDLVLVSSAATTYGTIILGKVRVPAIDDDQGPGFIHVRYVIYDTHAIGEARVRVLTFS